MPNRLTTIKSTIHALALEMMIFTIAAFVPFVSIPAIVHAQEAQFTPLEINGELSLSRGSFTPGNPDAFTLPREQYCELLVVSFGWDTCDEVDEFLLFTTADTDTLIINNATDGGYVSFEDWTEKNSAELVEEIEATLKASAEAQSNRSGANIEFLGWRLAPTLDQAETLMFYATDWSFDGEVSTNVNAVLFDRRGFITMKLVPLDNNLGSNQIESLIRTNLSYYEPEMGQDYASFQSGDKIAAVGALGLLGTFFGVKYGKTVATGALAVFLAFAKKSAAILVVLALTVIGGVLKLLSGIFRREQH